MNIAVVGTGYVGLVTGTCLAETGNAVICVDIDEKKVAQMKNGEVPIYEPHLDVLFERNIRQGRLLFTTDLKEGIDKAQIIFLALPTPPGSDGSADLSFIMDVGESLSKIITDYKIIVDKSTVPVGTADKVKKIMEKNCEVEVDVVSNPEFLREGFAVDDFMKPERIIIGSSSEKALKIMKELYRPFVRQGNPILFMDEKSAELTKYAANSFLATKITFMNEIANLCEKLGADVDAVRIGMGSDSRIGKRFLFPGIGYGGSCFPKDVLALVNMADNSESKVDILKSVISANEHQKSVLAGKIKSYYKDDLKGKHFALWGLAFKPDTDDMREAPSLTVIDSLLEAGATITAFDPEAMPNTQSIIGDKINYGSNAYDILEGADALLITTEWSVFRTPDFGMVSQRLKEKVIFDGRNLYDIDQMSKLGFYYNSIGRELVQP
ncbi:MAG TPA: UDP-glucose/GDP-mannose dehydrogenase family protein [Flavobacteriales bacterium]|nr:UDP-glucose/GDP-mannose dehydrogenase family protein [Flavobacteriales bacterium]